MSAHCGATAVLEAAAGIEIDILDLNTLWKVDPAWNRNHLCKQLFQTSKAAFRLSASPSHV